MDRKAMFVVASALFAEASEKEELHAYAAYLAAYAALWGMFPAGRPTGRGAAWFNSQAQEFLSLASLRFRAEEQHAKRAAAQ